MGLGSLWQAASDFMLKLLNFLYSITGSYGIAIILLTILVRIVLHPLSHKQMESLQKMQKLQPRIKMLQQKYANDKEKLNQEIMKLYREYGVNPAAGCLPLLAQLPILILLFRVLMKYDFGGATFLGIGLQETPLQALAKAFGLSGDNVGIMSVLTGIFTNPLGFVNVNVYLPSLLLLFGIGFITWYQQKISSGPATSQVAFMSWFMPAFLTFICLSLPGGVLLYWFVSSVIGVIQQKIVLKKVGSVRQEVVLYPNKPPKTEKKKEQDVKKS